MSKLIIEIETLASGQPRPYADSVDRFRVSGKFYWDSTTGPRLSDNYFLKDHEALAYVEATRLCPRFFAGDSRDRQWHEAYLKSIVQTSPGVWEIQIISPYLD
jgi:hypothetical protein